MFEREKKKKKKIRIRNISEIGKKLNFKTTTYFILTFFS